MSLCRIDHITVTAPTLNAGAAFVRQALGVEPQPGGEHPRMGTHNLLLRLGDDVFLEVIAPNPVAPAPSRPRWFGLDTLAPDASPALSTWVARTSDIRTTATVCTEPLGEVEPMTRGSLNWLITIPADRTVPVDGIAPALIEWHTDRHPASTLPDAGLSLIRLELFHPDPARVSRMLSSIGLDGPITVSSVTEGVMPHLVAHINTRSGPRVLSRATPAPA